MIKQISVTFGSKDILSNIMKKYPDRDLDLFSTNNNDTGLQLLDHSGKPTVFKSPIIYEALAHGGEDDWNHYINYVEVVPSEDQRKILTANVNQFLSDPDLPTGMYSAYYLSEKSDTSKRIILTLWENANNFSDWVETPGNFVAGLKNNPDIDFRSVGYQRVHPNFD